MPAPAWEDLDAFFALDTAGGFANTATLTPSAGGDPLSVRGIFDDPYLDAQLGEYDFNTSNPRFHCKSADVAAVVRGDVLALDGKTYDILDAPAHDGTGVATLKLSAPR